MTSEVCTSVMKLRDPSAKVTAENRTSVALNPTYLALESLPKYFSWSYVQSWSQLLPCVDKVDLSSWCEPLFIVLLCQLAFVLNLMVLKPCYCQNPWIFPSEQNELLVPVGREEASKEQKKICFCENPALWNPWSYFAPSEPLDPNLPLPTRHPEKVSCQPPSTEH